jgi:uncharacterized membrane protein
MIQIANVNTDATRNPIQHGPEGTDLDSQINFIHHLIIVAVKSISVKGDSLEMETRYGNALIIVALLALLLRIGIIRVVKSLLHRRKSSSYVARFISLVSTAHAIMHGFNGDRMNLEWLISKRIDE